MAVWVVPKYDSIPSSEISQIIRNRQNVFVMNPLKAINIGMTFIRD